MQLATVAYLDKDQLLLTESLLRPLGIRAGTPLSGAYYPPPVENGEPASALRHDIMLTPIPFELWPFCVSGRIDFHHEKGTLQTILDWLTESDVGLNILYTRCHRATHRHATLTFVGSLKDFAERSLDNGRVPTERTSRSRRNKYADDLARYTRRLRKRLEQKVRKDHEGIFARSSDEKFMRRPIGLWSLKALAYYYSVLKSEKHEPPLLNIRATTVDSKRISIHNPDHLFRITKLENETPTVAFASTDHEAFLIRVAIPTKAHLRNFRSVLIEYSFDRALSKHQPRFGAGREWLDNSTQGLLRDITHALRDDFNLWRVYNKTSLWTADQEEGEVRIVLERDTTHPEPTDPHQDFGIKAKLECMKCKRWPELKMETRVRPFSSRKIFVSIKGSDQLERAPEILEMCKKIGRQFGFIDNNIDTVKSHTDRSVSETVVTAISKASGFLQFIMADDDTDGSFVWLEAEFFLAIDRNIPRVRFFDPRLRSQYRLELDRHAKALPQHSSASRLQKAIRSAFEELMPLIDEFEPQG